MDRRASLDTAERVLALVARLARAGIRHLSRPVLRELAGFERSARAAGLVHLERELAALTSDAERYLDRSPHFRAGSFVDRLVRTEERARAAMGRLRAEPGPDDEGVLGVARRRYDPVAGTVVVEAVGATGFVSDAGFVGVTVVLSVRDTGEELLATVVRPSDVFGDDPRRLWYQPVSQISALTVAELSHGAWRLDDVRRSADGRLSLHAGLVAMPAAPMPSRALAPYRVSGLREATARLFARDDDAEGVRVCVEGLVPGALRVDETRGVVTVELRDAAGASATHVVQQLPRHDVVLDNLCRLRARPPSAMVGVLRSGAEGLRFEPQTAWFDVPLKVQHTRVGLVQQVHLTLEPMTGSVDRSPVTGRAPAPLPPDAAQALVDRGWELVVALISGGTTAPEIDGPELVDLAHDAEALGMPALATAAAALGASLAGAPPTEDTLALARRLRACSRGLAVLRLRDAELGQGPVPAPARRGADRRAWPLGVDLRRGRVEVLAVDLADGAPLLVRDEWTPAQGGVASRLFQAVIDPAAALAHVWVFTDHPSGRTRDGRELHPAWHTAPTLGERAPAHLLPQLESPGAAPCAVPVEARRGPDGWALSTPAGALVAEISSAATALLDKGPSPQWFVGTFAPLRGVHRLLAIDGAVPEVRPDARRWPWSDLARRAADAGLGPLVDAIRTGAAPPGLEPPPPLSPAETVELRTLVEVARKGVLAGEGLPRAAAVWAWGTSLGVAPPAAVLRADDEVRRAIVGPLSAWLAGSDAVDAGEALSWLAISGERDLHLA